MSESAAPPGQEVPTPLGPGRLQVYAAAAGGSGLSLLMSHGAGSGTQTADLLTLAAALPERGVTVALFDQPWVVAGRKVATAPPTLDVGLRAARDFWVAQDERVAAGLVVGGRSAGARSAARSALALEARGAVALAFPLHPPGRPERSRADELRACGVPLLVVQGERDSMGRPEEFPAPPSTGLDLAVIPHADHSLRVPARAPISHGQALDLVVDAVANWLAKLA